jgi:hypothetical protein
VRISAVLCFELFESTPSMALLEADGLSIGPPGGGQAKKCRSVRNLPHRGGARRQIGKKVTALRWWRRAGRGPAWTRIGHTPVYDQADVEAWLESLKRDPRAEVAA